MGAIAKYLKVMDNWERAAFLPYLFAPPLLIVLMMSLLTIENGIVAVIFLAPILLLGCYTLYEIISEKFHQNGLQYLVSGGLIVYTFFFPFFLLSSGINTSQFTLIYLGILLPVFLGHIYALIFQIVKKYSEEKNNLIIKK